MITNEVFNPIKVFNPFIAGINNDYQKLFILSSGDLP